MVVRIASRPPTIGRIGTAARVVGGLAFVAVAVGWFRATPTEALLGVVVLPVAATLLLAPPLRLGAAGHLVTVVIVLALLLVFPGESVLLFYGGTMLVAAASGGGGCEVTAVSNWLRRRDDQVGCPLFAPFDALDRARAGRLGDDGRA
ncbi:MAG TPA: hypothetical protein VG370_22480 [Chloroflexota bacterium]|nr:hypothetical protein [Chloroflexota bacterium]